MNVCPRPHQLPPPPCPRPQEKEYRSSKLTPAKTALLWPSRQLLRLVRRRLHVQGALGPRERVPVAVRAQEHDDADAAGRAVRRAEPGDDGGAADQALDPIRPGGWGRRELGREVGGGGGGGHYDENNSPRIKRNETKGWTLDDAKGETWGYRGRGRDGRAVRHWAVLQ